MTEIEQYPYRYASPDEIAQLYSDMEGMLVKVASTMYGQCSGCVEFDDLLSVGRLAFMKAVENFDTTKGFRFITFFGNIAKNAMRDLIKSTMCRAKHEVFEPKDVINNDNGSTKNISHEHQINSAVMRNNFNRTESDMLEEDIAKQEFFDLLDDIANTYMSDKERDVYYLYFRGDVRYKITEVAEMLGLKKYKVSELKNQVIIVLRNHLLEYDLDSMRADYLAGFFT